MIFKIFTSLTVILRYDGIMRNDAAFVTSS
jgi:hypothetical protein